MNRPAFAEDLILTSTHPFFGRRGLLAAGCLLSLAAVAAALVSQYAFAMPPCPWCILQRVIFLAVAAVCALGAVARSAAWQRAMAAAAALLAASGVAAAVYQNVVAAKAFSCNLTMADRIIGALRLESAVPFLFRIEASCADAAVTLWGLPYEYWSAALFGLIAVAGLALALRRRG